MNHINGLKDKNYVVISIYAEKSFDEIQCAFMLRVLEGIELEGTHHNVIKAIYNKPTANIIPNEEKLEAFLLKIKKLTRLLTISTLF